MQSAGVRPRNSGKVRGARVAGDSEANIVIVATQCIRFGKRVGWKQSSNCIFYGAGNNSLSLRSNIAAILYYIRGQQIGATAFSYVLLFIHLFFVRIYVRGAPCYHYLFRKCTWSRGHVFTHNTYKLGSKHVNDIARTTHAGTWFWVFFFSVFIRREKRDFTRGFKKRTHDEYDIYIKYKLLFIIILLCIIINSIISLYTRVRCTHVYNITILHYIVVHTLHRTVKLSTNVKLNSKFCTSL